MPAPAGTGTIVGSDWAPTACPCRRFRYRRARLETAGEQSWRSKNGVNGIDPNRSGTLGHAVLTPAAKLAVEREVDPAGFQTLPPEFALTNWQNHMLPAAVGIVGGSPQGSEDSMKNPISACLAHGLLLLN